MLEEARHVVSDAEKKEEEDEDFGEQSRAVAFGNERVTNDEIAVSRKCNCQPNRIDLWTREKKVKLLIKWRLRRTAIGNWE